MKNVIDRDCIHSEIEFHQFDANNNRVILKKQDFDESINHWKNILVELHNIGPGSKVGIICPICEMPYITLLYAILELGGQIIIVDSPNPPIESLLHTVKCRVLAPFDLLIDHDMEFCRWMAPLAKATLNMNIWGDYVSEKSAYSDIKLGTPAGSLMLAPTSGTTGTPKIVPYSHKFFYTIGERNQSILDFCEDDRVLHLTGINHGASGAIFFFPALRYCKYHYYENIFLDGILDTVFKRIQEEKINKIIFPNNLICNNFLMQVPELTHKLDLFCLQSSNKNWIKQIKRSRINSLTAIFGFTEAIGPLFKKTITQDSDDSTNLLNYGKPLDDYYKIDLTEESKLRVYNEHCGEHIQQDKFIIDVNGDYIFQGRADLCRINDIELPIFKYAELCDAYFTKFTAELIPDTTASKIYLLCDYKLIDDASVNAINLLQKKLNDISPYLNIDYVDYCEISNFYNGIKFNMPHAIEHFRTKFNII